MKTNKINVVLSLGKFSNLGSGNSFVGAHNSKYDDGSKDQTKDCKNAAGEVVLDDKYRFKPAGEHWGDWTDHP